MNLVLLSATLLALLSGPLLYAGAHERPAVLAFLDGFVLVAISGLVFLEVLPETLETGGPWTLAFLVAGALGPSLFERQLHNARQAHVAALLLAIGGLVLHSIGDGTALAPHAGDQARLALALAIAVHSVPVGLAVWWLLFPVFGALLPSLAIGAMCAGTIAGYVFAADLGGLLGATGWAWLQALVAGSILHVVFGRPHLEETSGHREASPPFEGLGNLSALAALIFLETLDAPTHHSHPAFLDRLIELALSCAPGLLAAYVIAGLIGDFAGRGGGSPAKSGPGALAIWTGLQAGFGGALGSQDPLPWHRALLRRGMPAASALAGLLVTSELALTALLISAPLLGRDLALMRISTGMLLSLVVARLLARSLAAAPVQRFRFSAPGQTAPMMRFGLAATLRPLAQPSVSERPAHGPVAMLRRAFIERVDSSAPWIVTGLLIAAWAAPFLDQRPWSLLPAMLLPAAFALLGLLFAASAAGATPLAAVLLMEGVSPGAALAFLLAGPAASPAVLGRIRELHGNLAAAGFGVVAVTVAAAIGMGIDAMSVSAALPPANVAVAQMHGASHPLQWLCSIVLCLLYAASLLRRGGRDFFGSVFPVTHVHHHHH